MPTAPINEQHVTGQFQHDGALLNAMWGDDELPRLDDFIAIPALHEQPTLVHEKQLVFMPPK